LLSANTFAAAGHPACGGKSITTSLHLLFDGRSMLFLRYFFG
jgi:hypothetical protein